MTRNDLIARIARIIEAAPVGSREMDALIYNEIKRISGAGMSHDAIQRAEAYASHYTTSLDAKLPGENIIRTNCHLPCDPLKAWSATHVNKHSETFIAFAATEALARRAAAMKGKGENHG